jgi:hypothetical protein
LSHRDLPPCVCVEVLRRTHAQTPENLVPAVGGDEIGILQPELQHRLQRAVEGGILGVVLEVGDENRHRIRLDRGRGCARQPPGTHNRRDRQRRRRHDLGPTEAPGRRQGLAFLVELSQILLELLRSLVTCLGIPLLTPKDDTLQRFRDLGIERSSRQGRLVDLLRP